MLNTTTRLFSINNFFNNYQPLFLFYLLSVMVVLLMKMKISHFQGFYKNYKTFWPKICLPTLGRSAFEGRFVCMVNICAKLF